jgi:GNAT superfamily N-acetyltransferase
MGKAVTVSEYLLRTADRSDLDALAAVYRRSSLSNDGDRDALLARGDVLSFDGAHLAEGRTRVAVAEGRIVGFVTTLVGGGLLELEDLFVDPDWMRHGVGRLLVADALVTARSSGCTGLEVTANPHALAFYRRVGFGGDAPVETELGAGTRMRLDVDEE